MTPCMRCGNHFHTYGHVWSVPGERTTSFTPNVLRSIMITPGADGLPAWFLRLGAPFLCNPLTHLFNMSMATSTVPYQWKQANIRPIAKVSAPKTITDFRLISVTPILTRMMERTVVRSFIYPTFHSPPPNLTFNDQFAYWFHYVRDHLLLTHNNLHACQQPVRHCHFPRF